MSTHASIPVLTSGHTANHGVPCAATVSAEVMARLCFPIRSWHPNDFRHGGTTFGAPRPHGRAHAGVDLLAPRGTPLLAMADGFVRQSPYYFYEGTNAIELVFPGVGVARYGEVTMHQDPPLRGGQHVKAGQLVGHVGRLNSGHSMLHFELYQGREPSKDVADFDHGGLTQRGRPPFQRHPNLVNPIQFMWTLHQRASTGA